MSSIVKMIQDELIANSEIGYRDFVIKLTPTVDPSMVLGVRVPYLNKLAKRVSAESNIMEFLESVPHKYHEENLLEAILISNLKDVLLIRRLLELFLPHVDNWAVCDSLRPKAFLKNPDIALNLALKYIESKEAFTIRFAIETLMLYFLVENYDVRYVRIVSNIRHDDYYVRMMVAWYFSTALYERYSDAIKVIESQSLEPWVHNKAIQKAIESRVILPERKEYLRSLRLKIK